MWYQGLMDMSVSPGMAVNALPRSCALTLSSTEWQQALTASLNQRNLHTMAPTLGSVGPLKMDRSIYKNTCTSGCLSYFSEQGEQQRITEERQDKRTRQWKSSWGGLRGQMKVKKQRERRWEIMRKRWWVESLLEDRRIRGSNWV